jgi:site-specific recombinase XerC
VGAFDEFNHKAMTLVTGSSLWIPFSEVREEEVANPIPASNVLTVDQVQHLFSVSEPNTVEGIRGRAILSLTVMCDLTVDEINQLEVSDLDLRNRILTINGKSGEFRRIAVPEDICKQLNEWISIRSRIKTQTLALFVPSDHESRFCEDD